MRKRIFIITVAILAICTIKACQPSVSPLEFNNLADAKTFLESKGLHCRHTKDTLNRSMIVMETPITMTSEEEERFQIAAHHDRLSDGILLIAPTNATMTIEIASFSSQWGSIYAIGDKSLVRKIESRFR